MTSSPLGADVADAADGGEQELEGLPGLEFVQLQQVGAELGFGAREVVVERLVLELEAAWPEVDAGGVRVGVEVGDDDAGLGALEDVQPPHRGFFGVDVRAAHPGLAGGSDDGRVAGVGLLGDAVVGLAAGDVLAFDEVVDGG
ncbi:hypothetical protein OG883_41160 [Streptomyces sp. NBC_01142]|uniref:hypothetical protein n=1 Tax=Streptomyces sp. NBC_01142 TaxID=2975865 RepID=UPI00224CD18D|nr:hypothetical protein [Streptomyces sp. NBC_01142]MCX4826082.1 hypothetical protein [Streptomyces sp. NBC_01142]